MKTTYGLNWIEVMRRLFAGIVCLIMLGTFGSVLIRIQLGFNGETLLNGVMTLLFLFAVLWLFQTVLGTLWQNPRFQLHERGVTLTTNDHEIDWDWDEFTNWSGKITYNKLYGVVTLYISGGCEFISDTKPPLVVGGLIKDAPKLAGTIITQSVNAQLPVQLEMFQQGKTLEFGSALLNKQGLQHGTNFIPFDDIAGVGRKQFFLLVHRKSQPKKPAHLNEDNVRAPELLLAVIQTLARSPKPNEGVKSL